MIRTIFAMAVAALVLAAVSGTSQAAPIAPLSAGAASGQGDLTQVYWHHGSMVVGIAIGVTAGGTAATAFAGGRHSTLRTKRVTSKSFRRRTESDRCGVLIFGGKCMG